MDWGRSITSNRFVLNIAQDHHLQVRCHSLLFHSFKWFKIKAAIVHLPMIQKETDELLAEAATEPSTGGAGFY